MLLSVDCLSPPRAARVLWPDLNAMRGATHTRRSNIGRQIKLAWSLLKTQPYRPQFNAVLERHSHWQAVFARQAKSFEPLVQSFMDRRYSVAQRFSHLQHDLATATQAFGIGTAARIAGREQVVLWTLGGGATVTLGLNEVCQREGMWTLALHTAQGVRVCQLSFSFLLRNRLMIGSVQGAPAQDAAAMQGIRELTHTAQGLRPPYLLVEVLRVLCRRWGQALSGVDPQHHVKKKWYQRALQVSFDYRAFWADLGGHKQANDIWALPSQRAPRDLRDVPAKRRATYKRRALLLAALPAQLQNLPGPAPGTG